MDRTALIREVDAWSAADPDETTRAELQELLAAGAFADLEDRFAGGLEFGTAGLRGVVGAGPNRMNRAVVRRATAGLAALPPRHRPRRCPPRCGRRPRRAPDEPGVRRGHRGGARRCGHPRPGAPDGFTPTPLCAFLVERLGAAAGVMVTASHNPPEYNGYKVYWGNGAQIIPPHDVGIAAGHRPGGSGAATSRSPTSRMRGRTGLVRSVGQELEQAYLEGVLALRLHPGEGTDLTHRLHPDARRGRAPGARGAAPRRVLPGPPGAGAAGAGSGAFPRSASRTPRSRGRWTCRGRSPSAPGPIWSWPTTRTRTGWRCSPGALGGRAARPHRERGGGAPRPLPAHPGSRSESARW